MDITQHLEIFKDINDLEKQSNALRYSFGKSIRTARKESEISLRELARRIGVSASYLSDVEVGRRTISKNNLIKISKII